MKSEGLISINEAARRKGVSRQAIHDAIRSGKLACIEMPSVVRKIDAQALDLYQVNPNMQRAGRKPSNGKKR